MGRTSESLSATSAASAPLKTEVWVALAAAAALAVATASGVAPMTWPEATGVASGFLGVWLARRGNPLAWVASGANAAAFGWIFFSYAAYANVAFQAVTLGLCLYGFAFWLGGRTAAPVPIVRASRVETIGAAAFFALFTLVLLAVRRDAPPALVGLDAASTALGFVATWMQSRKRLEGWIVNAAAIVLLIPLFVLGGSYALAVTAPAFIWVLLSNHAAWRRRLRHETTGARA